MDSYGIPDNLFGQVDERFYGGLGRVVVLSALLDDMLVRLRQSLVNEFQSVSAAKFGKDIRELCLDAAESAPPHLRDEVRAIIKQAQRLHAQRNKYVHGIWAQPKLDKALAWIPAIEQPYEAQTVIEWFEIDEARISSDIEAFARKLVTVIDALDKLQWKGHADKATRLGGKVEDHPTASGLGADD